MGKHDWQMVAIMAFGVSMHAGIPLVCAGHWLAVPLIGVGLTGLTAMMVWLRVEAYRDRRWGATP